MDKSALISKLREQASTLNQDVKKKLEYLSGNGVFQSNNYMEYLSEDMSLEDAFYEEFPESSSQDELASAFLGNNSSSSRSYNPEPSYTQSNTTNFDTSCYSATPQMTTSSVNDTKSEKERLLEKIAALRGISLPGDYIKKKF